MRWLRHTVADSEAGATVEEILKGPLGISGRMIQRLTRAGGISLNGRAPFLKRKVRPGDVVAARVAAVEEAGVPAVEMPLAIVHEDEHLLVVDKPAGVLVHPVGREGEVTLAHAIAHRFPGARVRPVHRLDRDTSGLVLFARSAYAHQALDRQLRSRELRRSYLAFVSGVPAEGTIDAPIGPHPRLAHLRAVGAGGDRAVTHLRVVEAFPGAALLEVELETGRTHQIRVHLAHVGHPVLGDAQYGGSTRWIRRQALHAARLAFRHPVGGEAISLESPLPPDLQALRETLRHPPAR